MKAHETVFIIAADKVGEAEKILSASFGQLIEVTAFGIDGDREVGVVAMPIPETTLSAHIETWRGAGIEVLFPSGLVHKALSARGIAKGRKKTELAETKKLKGDGK